MIQANFIQMKIMGNDLREVPGEDEGSLPTRERAVNEQSDTDFNKDCIENCNPNFLEEQENQESMGRDHLHRGDEDKDNLGKAIIKKRKLLQERLRRQGLQSKTKRPQNTRKGRAVYVHVSKSIKHKNKKNPHRDK